MRNHRICTITVLFCPQNTKKDTLVNITFLFHDAHEGVFNAHKGVFVKSICHSMSEFYPYLSVITLPRAIPALNSRSYLSRQVDGTRTFTAAGSL